MVEPRKPRSMPIPIAIKIAVSLMEEDRRLELTVPAEGESAETMPAFDIARSFRSRTGAAARREARWAEMCWLVSGESRGGSFA